MLFNGRIKFRQNSVFLCVETELLVNLNCFCVETKLWFIFYPNLFCILELIELSFCAHTKIIKLNICFCVETELLVNLNCFCVETELWVWICLVKTKRGGVISLLPLFLCGNWVMIYFLPQPILYSRVDWIYVFKYNECIEYLVEDMK